VLLIEVVEPTDVVGNVVFEPVSVAVVDTRDVVVGYVVFEPVIVDVVVGYAVVVGIVVLVELVVVEQLSSSGASVIVIHSKLDDCLMHVGAQNK